MSAPLDWVAPGSRESSVQTTLGGPTTFSARIIRGVGVLRAFIFASAAFVFPMPYRAGILLGLIEHAMEFLG